MAKKNEETDFIFSFMFIRLAVSIFFLYFFVLVFSSASYTSVCVPRVVLSCLLVFEVINNNIPCLLLFFHSACLSVCLPACSVRWEVLQAET